MADSFKPLCAGDNRFISFNLSKVNEAKEICKDCGLQKGCLLQAIKENHPYIAAGTTGFDRLVRRWKRIENEEENNFR